MSKPSDKTENELIGAVRELTEAVREVRDEIRELRAQRKIAALSSLGSTARQKDRESFTRSFGAPRLTARQAAEKLGGVSYKTIQRRCGELGIDHDQINEVDDLPRIRKALLKTTRRDGIEKNLQ